MSVLMQIVEDSQLRSEPLDIQPGSTVKVMYRVIEGEKERIQPFVGVVIRKRQGDKNSKGTFTVRKVVQGYGVERTFPMHSPRIESVEVMKVGVVRRAKLYYLRDLRGKATRIREKMQARPSVS
ncbi:50S ribosomal protein L19 [Deltaproteobacteria bacterium TL4]